MYRIYIERICIYMYTCNIYTYTYMRSARHAGAKRPQRAKPARRLQLGTRQTKNWGLDRQTKNYRLDRPKATHNTCYKATHKTS